MLSFDIGGTSADVAVIRDGKPAYGIGELVGEFPIYVPTVSVTSIGEGGGSIAWVDEFGVLQGRPRERRLRSRARPATAAAATRPTITDAFALLGLLGAAASSATAPCSSTARRRRARSAPVATRSD